MCVRACVRACMYKCALYQITSRKVFSRKISENYVFLAVTVVSQFHTFLHLAEVNRSTTAVRQHLVVSTRVFPLQYCICTVISRSYLEFGNYCL